MAELDQYPIFRFRSWSVSCLP